MNLRHRRPCCILALKAAIYAIAGAGWTAGRRRSVKLFKRLLRDSAGASAAEYALILGIVGSAIALAAMTLGVTIADSMNIMSNRIEACAGGPC